MNEEQMTAQESDNQEISESLLGTIAAPSINEIQNNNETKIGNTTINDEVSKTFDMEALLGMMDEDLRGRKTWEKFKTPADVAKSYVELEKMVGRKGDIPSDEDSPDLWNSFYLKLGKPETAEGYELELPDSLKQLDGISDKVEQIKSFAHEANLSSKQAQTLFNNIFEMEANDIAEAETIFNREMETNKQKLQEAWGMNVEQMSDEVRSLEERLGVFNAFEEAGLNNNADLLIAFGKIASDLKETSSIEMAIAGTPTGLKHEIEELNSQAAEFIKSGKKVPAHIQAKLQDAFRKMG